MKDAGMGAVESDVEVARELAGAALVSVGPQKL